VRTSRGGNARSESTPTACGNDTNDQRPSGVVTIPNGAAGSLRNALRARESGGAGAVLAVQAVNASRGPAAGVDREGAEEHPARAIIASAGSALATGLGTAATVAEPGARGGRRRGVIGPRPYPPCMSGGLKRRAD
jgi:hypothetical protein